MKSKASPKVQLVTASWHLDGCGCSLAGQDALGHSIHSGGHFWEGLVGWQALAQGGEFGQPGIQDGPLLRVCSQPLCQLPIIICLQWHCLHPSACIDTALHIQAHHAKCQAVLSASHMIEESSPAGQTSCSSPDQHTSSACGLLYVSSELMGTINYSGMRL